MRNLDIKRNMYTGAENHPHTVRQNKNKERLYYDNPKLYYDNPKPKLMGDDPKSESQDSNFDCIST